MKTVLVTGGCGFIGSNFIRLLSQETDWRIINLDKLTYAGNLDNVADLPRTQISFVHGDICDAKRVRRVLEDQKPSAVVNFAAESHVDRSILDASPFLQTNIACVQCLLEAIRLCPVERFIHISTDEVYGDKQGKSASSEDAVLFPSSPYAATKAAADLLCFSYRRTYGLPVIVTRSSNNYGPFQFPEKLIPLLIRNALEGGELPVYGDGRQIRDWLHVEDNCRAILGVLENGHIGDVYNIGTQEEHTNLEVVGSICAAIAEQRGLDPAKLRDQIRFVPDRPGHDRRYALETNKIRREIGWRPRTSFAEGLKQTVAWYLNHADWVGRVVSGEYHKYYESVYKRAWGKTPAGAH